MQEGRKEEEIRYHFSGLFLISFMVLQLVHVITLF